MEKSEKLTVFSCKSCKHGSLNDYWGTYFCDNRFNCEDWNLWEPKDDGKEAKQGQTKQQKLEQEK